jgi:hypothetical protein
MPSEQREAAQAQRRAFGEKKKKRTLVDRRPARFDPIGPIEQALNLEKSQRLLHYLFTGDVFLPISADALPSSWATTSAADQPGRTTKKETLDFAASSRHWTK